VELLEQVKIYNAVPPEAANRYREALLREFSEFCAREREA
jgi:hypothetical protein